MHKKWCPIFVIFVDPGTKVDGCYCPVVLMQQILPSIRSVAGDAYVFQQDSAPVHRAHQMVELLQRETPKFIAPVLILTPYTIEYEVLCRILFIRRQFKTWPIWSSAWLRHGTDYHRVSSMMLSTNGGRDLGPAWRKKENISNTCCNIWTWTRLVVQLNLLCFRLCIVQQWCLKLTCAYMHLIYFPR